MDFKVVCRNVYPVCQHECGELLSASEAQAHICPSLCQRWISFLDWSGHQVVRQCGEENVRILGYYANYAAVEVRSTVDGSGPQKNEVLSVAPQEDDAQSLYEARTGHVLPTGSTEDKMETSSEAQQLMVSSTTGKTSPDLRLESSTSKTADSGHLSPVGGPSSRFAGWTQEHSEEMEFPVDSCASNEASGPLSFLSGQEFFVEEESLGPMEGMIMNDDILWQLGFAKCSNGHLYLGNLEFCDSCGEVNGFYYLD